MSRSKVGKKNSNDEGELEIETGEEGNTIKITLGRSCVAYSLKNHHCRYRGRDGLDTVVVKGMEGRYI